MAEPRSQAVRVDLSIAAERLSLLAGLTAGLAYSIFASFVMNALTPVTGLLVETDSFRRIASGHYQEILSLDGADSNCCRIADRFRPGLVVDARDHRALAA